MESSPKSLESESLSYDDEQDISGSDKEAYDDEMIDLLLSNPEEYIRRRELELDELRRTREAEVATTKERHITALDIAARQQINGRAVFTVPAIIRGFKARKR